MNRFMKYYDLKVTKFLFNYIQKFIFIIICQRRLNYQIQNHYNVQVTFIKNIIKIRWKVTKIFNSLAFQQQRQIWMSLFAARQAAHCAQGAQAARAAAQAAQAASAAAHCWQ